MRNPQHEPSFTDPDGPGWLDSAIEEFRRDPEYIAEALALRVIQEALEMMDEEGISRAELAESMGVTRQRISHLFNAQPNLTLRSVAQLAVALQTEPHISLRPSCPPTSDVSSLGPAVEAGTSTFSSDGTAATDATLPRHATSMVA
jgi:plasmid maintenance system antidote protein VapI